MKARTLALLYISLLTTIIIGAAFTLSRAAAGEVGASVAWDPKNYLWLDNNFPEPWNAEIWLKGGHKAQIEINTTTIQLAGPYSPYATENAVHGPRLIAHFHGVQVGAALAASHQIPDHMGIFIPGTYRVYLEITGYLKPEYGGTLFRGDGVIVVTIPNP